MSLYIRGDNGERKKREKESTGVMMLLMQACGTEYFAHHTHIDRLFCLFVFMFLFFFLFLSIFHLFSIFILKTIGG